MLYVNTPAIKSIACLFLYASIWSQKGSLIYIFLEYITDSALIFKKKDQTPKPRKCFDLRQNIKPSRFPSQGQCNSLER